MEDEDEGRDGKWMWGGVAIRVSKYVASKAVPIHKPYSYFTQRIV